MSELSLESQSKISTYEKCLSVLEKLKKYPGCSIYNVPDQENKISTIDEIERKLKNGDFTTTKQFVSAIRGIWNAFWAKSAPATGVHATTTNISSYFEEQSKDIQNNEIIEIPIFNKETNTNKTEQKIILPIPNKIQENKIPNPLPEQNLNQIEPIQTSPSKLPENLSTTVSIPLIKPTVQPIPIKDEPREDSKIPETLPKPQRNPTFSISESNTPPPAPPITIQPIQFEILSTQKDETPGPSKYFKSEDETPVIKIQLNERISNNNNAASNVVSLKIEDVDLSYTDNGIL